MAVPSELSNAIHNSSQAYGVPEDVLTRVWRVESGSTFPNPAVNSSGYGGLFGTKEWNASTQEQANLAASILATGHTLYGNWEDALSYYRTGKPGLGYPGGGSGSVKSSNSIPVISGLQQAGDIPGAINNFSSTISNIPNTIMADLKPIGIGVGIGLLAILLVVVGIFVIVAPAVKNNMPSVVPIPV